MPTLAPSANARVAGVKLARALLAICCIAALLTVPDPPGAAAQTAATIAPSLSPDRLGATATLTLGVRYSGGPYGVPPSLRRSVLELPAGMELDIPQLRACTAVQLRARGAAGCPPQAELGTGQVLAEVHAGSQILVEPVSLWMFLGPPRGLSPTFQVLGQGYSPLEKRIVLTGTVVHGAAPYGEELVVSLPPISTVQLEPDASVVSVSLSVGARQRPLRRLGNRVIVPSRCPAGGFPFAGEFTFADGSTSSAHATVPCPHASARRARRARPRTAYAGAARRRRKARARAARTLELSEVGHLHLISKHNFTLNERGSATGTVAGAITVRLSAVSSTKVVCEVSVSHGAGSITTKGSGSYHRGTTQATFAGSMSIVHGSGPYAHAQASGLAFSGTIQASNNAITVRVSGKVSA